MAYKGENEKVVEIGFIEKNRRGDKIFVRRIESLDGSFEPSIDIRMTFEDEEGNDRMTQKGVRIKKEQLSELLELLNKSLD